jgi:hypothetical protein
MPLIWRGMKMEEGRPEMGRGGNFLGVRVGPIENGCDIDPDGDGFVNPGNGMSVSASVEALPPHRLPGRLQKKYPERFPEATGPNGLQCWWMGEGAFVAERVADRLRLLLDPDDPKRHGLVEPDDRMKIDDYETAVRLWLNCRQTIRLSDHSAACLQDHTFS